MFHCIVADPPWNESGGGRIKRGADRHYPLMKTPQIIELMASCPLYQPAENAHMYLWVTNNFLRDGLAVLDALGWRYVTMLTWAKEGKIGLGQYYRGMTEHVLFAVRGVQPALARTESTLILAPRGAHSVKPQAFYDRVERVSPGPRLEMFARIHRPGWTAWGNEVLETLWSA